MANEQNLKPFTEQQSRDEAVRNGKKGGKASGKARRERKAMKEQLERMLMDKLPEGLHNNLKQNGLTDDEGNDTFQGAILFSQMIQAVKGDTRAANWISEMTGEHIQQINVTQQIDESNKELEAYLNGSDKRKKESS